MSGETGAVQSAWTVDTLREYLLQKITDQRDAQRQQVTDLRTMLDERYATQTKALDAAFKAAEQAVAVALANAEKATIKAEDAANKRFESVNEFRQTLTDQAATFMPRAEYESAHKALDDKFETEAKRNANAIAALASRMDRGEGTTAGGREAITETRAGATFEQAGVIARAASMRTTISLVMAAMSLVVALITVIILVTRKGA